MAYDESLAQRLRAIFAGRDDIVERKMFGGLAFLRSGHMCCGVIGGELMARVGPDQYQAALQQPHARQMDFTGRPLTGFIYVGCDGIRSDKALESWVRRCEALVDSLPDKA